MAKLVYALNKALQAANLQAQDAAAVALAKRYAEQLDADDGDGEVLADVGPKLLATLTALAMTPAGRGVKGVRSGSGPRTPTNPLDELRERRATAT